VAVVAVVAVALVVDLIAGYQDYHKGLENINFNK